MVDVTTVIQWHKKQADYYLPFGPDNEITKFHSAAAKAIEDSIKAENNSCADLAERSTENSAFQKREHYILASKIASNIRDRHKSD
jgi:hypothetical protein